MNQMMKSSSSSSSSTMVLLGGEAEIKKDLLVDDSFSSSSSFSSSESLSSSSSSSLESADSSEEVTSPASTSSSSLLDMSSLFQQLPIKRGLSRHYEGKSQSFTSLANVKSVEDLAKPENPYNKKLKCCRKSYGVFMNERNNTSISDLSKKISSCKTSRSSCSSLSVKRRNRPPLAPLFA